MTEIWKDIKGYEGLYKVSNTGKVYSYKRKKELRANGQGYPSVNLVNGRSSKHKYIHRLVAEAFIPNPDNKSDVNHINGVTNDNRVTNLEWTTRMENIQKYLVSDRYKQVLEEQRRKRI